MQPHHIIHLRVHTQFVLQRVLLRRHRLLVQLHRKIVMFPVGAGHGVFRGHDLDGTVRSGSECRVRLPGAAEPEEVVSGGEGIVGGRINLDELDGGDDRSVGGEAIETEIGGGIEECEEIGVGAVAGGGFRPGGAPAEEDSGGEGNVEGRRAGLVVVVVVDGEGAKEVAAGGERREGVAVFFTVGGRREEAKGFFRGEFEAERFGDDGGGAAGGEAIGEPCGVEGISGVCGSAAVDVIRETCEVEAENEDN
ncbi:putative common plant regulatory factor 1-like [Sesbania bispinosa]|nr:putative common plant regulatory factor 1-like [Sesbania bispinosa]